MTRLVQRLADWATDPPAWIFVAVPAFAVVALLIEVGVMVHYGHTP